MTWRQKLLDLVTATLLAGLLFTLGALALASSCATVTPAMVIEDTAIGLKGTGEMFLATAEGMYAHCSTRDGLFTDAQCREWLQVERTFKKAFHVSVGGVAIAIDTQGADGGVDLPALSADVRAFFTMLNRLAPPRDGGTP